ncbi:MAG: hypothetical protein ACYC96_04645 [Fimbriimonadaceae bacterium]
MGKTSYYSAGGELYGESTDGVATAYMSDALGSTLGTITSAGVQNRCTYSPYGRVTSKTGTDPDPRFRWNGRTQSRTTNLAYAEQYNKRRHFSSTSAQWTTRDLLWRRLAPYDYGAAAPQTVGDPSGLRAIMAPTPPRTHNPIIGSVHPPMPLPPGWETNVAWLKLISCLAGCGVDTLGEPFTGPVNTLYKPIQPIIGGPEDSITLSPVPEAPEPVGSACTAFGNAVAKEPIEAVKKVADPAAYGLNCWLRYTNEAHGTGESFPWQYCWDAVELDDCQQCCADKAGAMYATCEEDCSKVGYPDA